MRALLAGLTADLPPRAELGWGLGLPVEGWCRAQGRRIAALEIGLGGHWEPVRQMGLRGARHALEAGGLGHGFRALIMPPEPARPCRLALALRARFKGGGQALAPLGHLLALPFRRPLPADPSARGGLAICMATHDPDLRLLARELASIRAQTRRDWTCFIQDDASPAPVFARMRALVGRDPRFHLARNSRNLGFYANYETCLRRAPAACAWVATADQDDCWHPKKLELLTAALESRPGAWLAYCDMRVTDASGRQMHPSYYAFRRNSWGHLGDLMVANTISGASMVFRRALLDAALPLPAAQRGSFHDHWLACVGHALGEVVFVDRPLVDYTQHGRNVIGHQPSRPQGPFWRADLALGRDLLKAREWPRHFAWAEDWLETPLALGSGWARCLLARLPGMRPAERGMLRHAEATDRSVWAAARRYLGARLKGLDDMGMSRAGLRAHLFLALGRATVRFGPWGPERAPGGRV